MSILSEYSVNIPSTLPDQVSIAREIDLSYSVLHPKLIIKQNNETENIMVPFSSLVNKYRSYLSNIIMSSTLSESEYRKYCYKPKTLSQDLYESTELWDTLLTLNQCVSIREFNMKTVKFYDPDLLKRYLNEILILEGLFQP